MFKLFDKVDRASMLAYLAVWIVVNYAKTI